MNRFAREYGSLAAANGLCWRCGDEAPHGLCPGCDAGQRAQLHAANAVIAAARQERWEREYARLKLRTDLAALAFYALCAGIALACFAL